MNRSPSLNNTVLARKVETIAIPKLLDSGPVQACLIGVEFNFRLGQPIIDLVGCTIGGFDRLEKDQSPHTHLGTFGPDRS